MPGLLLACVVGGVYALVDAVSKGERQWIWVFGASGGW